MGIFVLGFLIGVMVGLRSMMGPAVVSWAARLGWMRLEGTPLAFMGATVTPYLFTVLAIGELIADKLPKTPSRKAPAGFIARVVSGALCGASIGAANQSLIVGMVGGMLGAVAGTYGGYAYRARLAQMIGKDTPAAIVEDFMALIGALWVVAHS